MKTEIAERANLLLEITIIPETVEETAMLMRFSANASAEKPYVRLSFRNKPYCYICLKQIKPSSSIAKFTISPKHQKY